MHRIKTRPSVLLLFAATQVFLFTLSLSSQTTPFLYSKQNANPVSLPLDFEVNRGQAQPGVDFLAHGQGYDAYLTAGRETLRPNPPDASGVGLTASFQPLEAEIQLIGANERPELQPEGELSGVSNYLFGSDPRLWITGVKQYRRVGYRDIYPGIDIVYHGNQNRLEHDFVVHPEADTGQICLALSGVEKAELSNDGELRWPSADGEFRLEKPRAYQLIGGEEKAVSAEYVLHRGCANFRLGNYDAARELVIDPVLVYSTFLGGGLIQGGNPGINGQAAYAALVDGSGNLYVAGITNSPTFPVTAGVVGTAPPARIGMGVCLQD